MSLIKCPECGKSFSDMAAACPHCAYPLTGINKLRLGIGDAQAAMELADKYYSEENYKSAFEIYRALATGGDCPGSFKAGCMLYKGLITQGDSEKGLSMIISAGEAEYPPALYFLARHYDNNNAPEKALEYYKTCSKNLGSFTTDEQSCIFFRLGCLLPLESNPGDKVLFLEKAMSLGKEESREKLADLYLKFGDGAFEKGNSKNAAEYYEKAEELAGNNIAVNLGACYFNLSRDSEKTQDKLNYLTKACNAGSGEAKEALGKYYLNIGKNNRDIESLEKSAGIGNRQAGEILMDYYNSRGAECYKKGGKKDIAEALDCFIKACDLGSELGKKNLSVLYNYIGVQYYNNNDAEEDGVTKAQKFFIKARDLGNKNAEKNLGIIYNQYGTWYAKGESLVQNCAAAEKYYQQAAEAGNRTAEKNLVKLYVDCYYNYRYGLNGFLCDKVRANRYLTIALRDYPNLVAEIGEDYLKKANALIAQGIDHSNYKKIIGCLKKSSRLGKYDNTQQLISIYKTVSRLYKKGAKGFEKSKFRSNHYMKRAAELGDPEAMKKYKP